MSLTKATAAPPWWRQSSRPAVLIAMLAVAGMMAALPWLIPRAAMMATQESTPPLSWVPPTFPARHAYEEFIARFGSGDVIVISWEGCRLGAPKVAELIATCNAAHGPQAGDEAAWFEPALSGADILARLTEPPLSLPRDEALLRLGGGLIGADGSTTCVVLPLTRAGLAARRHVVAWLRGALREAGLGDAHLAGPVIDNVTVDEASHASLTHYAPVAAGVVLLLTWWSLGSLLHAGLVFIIALFCVGSSFAAVAACGDHMNPVLIVMPLLILVLGVSSGVHLVNYLTEAYQADGDAGLRRAVQAAWLPCLLSAGTTAIGLGSLVVSELEPIQVFGFHAAGGVLLNLLLLFAVIPGCFALWPIRRPRRRLSGRALAVTWNRFGLPHAGKLVMAAGLGVTGLGAGLPMLRSSVAIDTLFTPESVILKDYAWIENRIGPLAPVEVIVEFGADSPLRPAARLDLVEHIAEVLGRQPGVSGVFSAASFFPPPAPDASGIRRAARKAVIARRLEGSLSALDDLRLIHQSGARELWRVTGRCSAVEPQDNGRLLATIAASLEPVIAADSMAGQGVSLSMTGAMPLIDAIQRSLLHDLATSFLSACGIISVVMIVTLRSVAAGLVAMTVNIFPMVLLFGLLGHLSTPLDIGGMMTASIALGMAIDGTLHFLTLYRRGLPAGADPWRNRKAGIWYGFAHTAGAILQTAAICGIGMLVFTASPFAPTRRFAWMLATLVGLAAIGDLLLLPALLTTPLGRFFRASGIGSIRQPAASS
jgi:predicted RND superfamily exporter protein